MIAAGYRPSGPYRGAKATIYEGGHRVPFIVRWPGKVAAGSTCDVTICTTDFFTTFAELLGKKSEIPDNAAEDSSSLPCQNATFRVSVFAASIDLTPRSILTEKCERNPLACVCAHPFSFQVPVWGLSTRWG